MHRLTPVVVLGVMLAGCTASGPAAERPASDSSTPTSPAAPALRAELLQFSHDTARGRMVVQVHNDAPTPFTPQAVTYDDPRLGPAIPADRMREIPAGSQRSYPVPLPLQPPCTEPAGTTGATVTVSTADGPMTLPVADPTDVVARHVAERCLVLAAAEVAELRWADRVRVEGDRAWLVLAVRPTGAPGRLRIGDITGTHLLTPVGTATWRVRRTVRGSDRPFRLALPVAPARCDGHAFAEGGNATAFRVRLAVGGRRGPVWLRMSDRGAAAALDFGARRCGLR